MSALERLQAAVECLLRVPNPINYNSPPYLRVTCACGRKRLRGDEKWITYEIWDDRTSPWAKRFTVCSPACLHAAVP